MTDGARRANVARLLRLAGVADDDSAVRDEIERAMLRRSDEAVRASVLQLRGLRSVECSLVAANEARRHKAYADARLLISEISARLEPGRRGALRRACEALAGQPKRPAFGEVDTKDCWPGEWQSVQRRYLLALKLLARNDDEVSANDGGIGVAPCELSAIAGGR